MQEKNVLKIQHENIFINKTQLIIIFLYLISILQNIDI